MLDVGGTVAARVGLYALARHSNGGRDGVRQVSGDQHVELKMDMLDDGISVETCSAM